MNRSQPFQKKVMFLISAIKKIKSVIVYTRFYHKITNSLIGKVIQIPNNYH